MLRTAKAIWNWVDDRLGLTETLGPLAKHAVPKDAKWWYVFGSATLLAFIVQVVTGVVLAFSYIPSPSQAYQTLQFISNEAAFGRFMRGLHYYGASAMVLMIGAHMAQVFLFGSYKFPREMSWVTGVLLLGFTLLMGFTGQLLRWDQTAVWSVVVAAEQAGRFPLFGNAFAHFVLGGETVGGATLGRFFAIHVFLVPACIFAFVGLHLLLVMRHGISEPPKVGDPVDPKTYRQNYHELLKKNGCPFWPDAAWRDVVFGTVMLLCLVLLALFFGPPELGKPPDPSLIRADPRPDWYLLWYFAVLALMPDWMERYFMVLGPMFAGLLIIMLPFFFGKGERSPLRRPWAIAGVIMVVLTIGSFWYVGAKSPWSPNFDAQPLPANVVGMETGPVANGARLFHAKGCLNCHLIETYGGRRGPDLSNVGGKLSRSDIVIRIVNGGQNMPAYGNNLTPDQLNSLVAFLQSRKKTLVGAPRTTGQAVASTTTNNQVAF
jgi:ubiquinol-cytochrome c reductase cytochrome b subunit